MADRAGAEARRPEIRGEAAGTRAREMRLASFLVHEEALAVSEAESPASGSLEAPAESPSLEA